MIALARIGAIETLTIEPRGRTHGERGHHQCDYRPERRDAGIPDESRRGPRDHSSVQTPKTVTAVTTTAVTSNFSDLDKRTATALGA